LGCAFAAASILLHFEGGIDLGILLLWMMNRAIRLGADLPQFSNACLLKDDSAEEAFMMASISS
jgi:hypothetical protein